MSPLLGYKQTAEHILNRFHKKKKRSAARKKSTARTSSTARVRARTYHRQARISVANAAKKLQSKFQNEPWFTTVGAGKVEDRDYLFMYVSSFPRARSAFPQHQHAAAWYGLPVVLRRRARVRRPARTSYQAAIDIIDNPANEAAINDILAQHQKRFDEARAYLKRIDTTPDANLTHEERFIKRMGERS